MFKRLKSVIMGVLPFIILFSILFIMSQLKHVDILSDDEVYDFENYRSNAINASHQTDTEHNGNQTMVKLQDADGELLLEVTYEDWLKNEDQYMEEFGLQEEDVADSLAQD